MEIIFFYWCRTTGQQVRQNPPKNHLRFFNWKKKLQDSLVVSEDAQDNNNKKNFSKSPTRTDSVQRQGTWEKSYNDSLPTNVAGEQLVMGCPNARAAVKIVREKEPLEQPRATQMLTWAALVVHQHWLGAEMDFRVGGGGTHPLLAKFKGCQIKVGTRL